MLTPKQEAFVLAYIELGNASDAYRRAYDASRMKPETVNRCAFELLAHPKITARLDALRKEHAARHEVTVDGLIAELEQARALALETKSPAAMVAATMGKAKIAGKVIDRSELSGKDGGPIETYDVSPRDEFARRIAGIAARLREGEADRRPDGGRH